MLIMRFCAYLRTYEANLGPKVRTIAQKQGCPEMPRAIVRRNGQKHGLAKATRNFVCRSRQNQASKH